MAERYWEARWRDEYARNARMQTALKAARLVLLATGLFEDSRIILTIDAALIGTVADVPKTQDKQDQQVKAK